MVTKLYHTFERIVPVGAFLLYDICILYDKSI